MTDDAKSIELDLDAVFERYLVTCRESEESRCVARYPSRLRSLVLIAACVAAAVMAGCAATGPPTIPRDRFDYVANISDSWKRAMLQNLLKIRYADAPVFLDVGTVINSYSRAGEVNASGQLSPPSRGDTTVGVGASARYSDQPTISYAPLSGERFVRSLMQPIPLAAILGLVQSGYDADTVLRICINTINGLNNEFGGPRNPRAGDPRFVALVEAIRDAQVSGALGFRFKSSKEEDETVMYVRRESAELSGRVAGLLGLNPTATEYRLVYSPFASNDTEIAVVSRSVLQILIEYASYIDVPPSEVAEGRVYAPARSTDQERLFPPLIRVRNGESAPADAYVALRYRDRAFWIDDRDYASKTNLNILMMMFSLAETSAARGVSPVVTIPVR